MVDGITSGNTPPARSLKNRLKKLVPEQLLPYNIARRHVLRRTKLQIAGGPFRGMSYVDKAINCALYPKLMGTYEKELFPAIEEICRHGYKLIINVGAAEGYYAVGLALRMPNARIIAFERDEDSIALFKTLCAANYLPESRVSIAGNCSAKDLADTLAQQAAEPGQCLIVLDIEGGEKELLDPVCAPDLADSDILVELHDCFVPGLSALLKERFKNTHQITEIKARERTVADLPFTLPLLNASLVKLLFERNPANQQVWFYMKTIKR